MNADEIRKWHKTFKRDDELFEIRLIGDRTWSGYFYDVEQAIEKLQPFDNLNIYFTVNEVKKACASRSQFGCFQQVKSTATSKQDIEHRWWIPIDVDCERPSGVSSTDEEKKLAYNKAGDIFRFLKANGFSEPIVCDSSSGYHIFLPIDIDNTSDAELTIKTFLETLGNNFTDDHVKIDCVLHDANRIIRLPGSYGRKGRSTEERPHRQAKILYVPDNIVRMKKDFIDAFNEKYKVVTEQPTHRYNNYNNSNHEEFSLRNFIKTYNISVAKEIPLAGGGTKFVLTECPFDAGHKAPDSALFEMPNGSIAFKCFHNSCSQYDWRAFRLHFDPHAYDPKPQQQYQPQRYSKPRQPQQPPKPIILPETAEKGKKWLSMKDIKKVNISELPHFLTGITQLDNAIKGFFDGEVTIFSGANSSGKSSLLNTIIANAIQQGIPTSLFSGELPAPKVKAWLQMVIAGTKHMKHSDYGDYWYVPNDIGEKIDKWLDGKFFLYNDEVYSNKWEQILSDMKELASIGVKFFILDNLMSMDINIFGDNLNKQQKGVIIEIVKFAKETQSHLILVAHPRKATGFIRKTDISGSSDLTNAVDNVLIIHRVNNDFRKTGKDFFGAKYISQFDDFGNVIEVAKNRGMGAQDFLVGLFYEVESRRFKNTKDEVREYGWRDDIGTQQDMFTEPKAPAPVIQPTTSVEVDDNPFDKPIDYDDDNEPF